MAKITSRSRTLRAISHVITLMLLLTASTSGAAEPTRVVCGACEQADRFVRLQTPPRESHSDQTSGFTHPFRLSPEEWTTILRSIYVQRYQQGFLPLTASSGPAVPAFSEEEVEYLRATLPRAFSEAQADEWIIFELSHVRSPETIEVTDVTSGAWFVKGQDLHLVLANYREAVTLPGIRELLRQDPLHSIAGPRYDFVPGHHQQVLQGQTGLQAILRPVLPELIIDYQTLLHGESDYQTTPHSPAPSQSIEERLQTLKRLKEQGLITDDDYQAKKKMLLEKL